jgi:predicted nucleotidyltransferase
LGCHSRKDAGTVRADNQTLDFRSEIGPTGELLAVYSASLREKVAREAATLLYAGMEKEFKQAKLKASETFRTHFLPTNLEVALEIDKLAGEREGPAREERLVKMRKDALGLMQILKDYSPLLIGSVWRGTIHYASDIDIVASHDEPTNILNVLKQNRVQIIQTESVAVTKEGKRKGSFHIYAALPDEEKAEIKVVSRAEASREEKCEIYGDQIRGLRTEELAEMLQKNPLQRFLPS